MKYIELLTNACITLGALIPVLTAFWASVSKRFQTCEEDRKQLATRISALEIAQVGDVPKWIRDSHGIFQFVSPEFIRVFGAPYGLQMVNFIGKKFSDLPFSPELVATLDKMDKEALQTMYASRHGVRISEGVTATIIKSVRMGQSGEVVYVGYASPDR